MSYVSHPVQQPHAYPMGETDGSHLSTLEREILGNIPTDGWSYVQSTKPHWSKRDGIPPSELAKHWTPTQLSHESAIIVWVSEFGLAMGAVRARHAAGTNGWTVDTFEATPFPGGWGYVPIDRILLVRHPQAM